MHPYTVNDVNDMRRLNQYGVDGVFTNYADQYKAVSKHNNNEYKKTL